MAPGASAVATVISPEEEEEEEEEVVFTEGLRPMRPLHKCGTTSPADTFCYWGVDTKEKDNK
jgi:hypothetical protein